MNFTIACCSASEAHAPIQQESENYENRFFKKIEFKKITVWDRPIPHPIQGISVILDDDRSPEAQRAYETLKRFGESTDYLLSDSSQVFIL